MYLFSERTYILSEIHLLPERIYVLSEIHLLSEQIYLFLRKTKSKTKTKKHLLSEIHLLTKICFLSDRIHYLFCVKIHLNFILLWWSYASTGNGT